MYGKKNIASKIFKTILLKTTNVIILEEKTFRKDAFYRAFFATIRPIIRAYFKLNKSCRNTYKKE